MTLLHIVFGTVALLAVPAALFVRKGGAWHRRFGVAFALAMSVVLFSAGFMWQAKGHLFLVPLGLVSAYLVFNAFRVLARARRRAPSPLDDAVDIAAAFAVMAAGGFAAYLGATAATPLLVSIRPALIGIGTIAIAFGLNDVLGFLGPRMRLGWLLAHFAAMLAAYISAVTAFLVINAHAVPMMVRWLVPSLLGATVIVGYTLRYTPLRLPVALATALRHLMRVASSHWLRIGRKTGSGRTL
jgi:uncharacterized membrane protein